MTDDVSADAPNAEFREAIASLPINFCAVGSGTPVSAASSPADSRADASRRAAAVIITTA